MLYSVLKTRASINTEHFYGHRNTLTCCNYVHFNIEWMTTVATSYHTDPSVENGFDDALEFGRNFEHKVLVETRLDRAAGW